MSNSIAPGIKQVLQVWPLVVFLVAVSGVIAEARYRLSALEGRVEQSRAQQEQRYDTTNKELRKMNNELRMGLGRVQLSMARICIKLDVECD
jgi:hypothetical protein